MKLKFETTGPTTVTLPSTEGWPTDKDNNPLAITVVNNGDEPVCVEPPKQETLVLKALEAKRFDR